MPDNFFSNVQLKDGTIVNVKDSTARELLEGKVDKVTGKGLSTNDFTDALLTKLNGIQAGAEVNVIESVSQNGTPLTITDKSVNVTVPTKVSDLTNDSNFVSVSYGSTNKRIVFA